MTRDVETLTQIAKWFLFIAATMATAFPLLYSFSPWWSTTVGRLLMFKAISFALVLDMTVVFQFWQPEDILIYFWVQVVCFTLIAISTGLLTFFMVRMNYKRWRFKDSEEQGL